MSEPEIIRLRKEIRRLKELNEKLNQDNESLNNEIGQLQLEKLSKRNQQEVLNQTSLIVENKEKMRAYIENLLETEREKLEAVEKKNNELEDNLKIYEKKLKANEIYIQKIQQENNDLKRNLIDFEKKHEGKDIIDNQRNRDDAIQKKEKDYQKLVFEWNELRDKMEEVLNENRILRQMADVPENFGIDIEKIKMGDRIKIEDYKVKIRTLENEVDNLESERTKLKHRLMFLNNIYQNNDYPFNVLSKEQKLEVYKFAQDLYEGKKNIQPEKYELIKENEKLKAKIDFLEEENYKFKTGRFNNINNKENLNELVRSIVKEEREKFENNNTNINNLNKINLNTSSNYNNVNIILNSNNSYNFNFYNNNNFEQVLNKVNKKENQINSSQSNSSQTTNSNFIFFNIFSF